MSTAKRPPAAEFRKRLLAREPLLGTLIKTPSIHGTEILGELGFDFVVTDAEHPPYDRASIDQILLAAKAWDIAAIVRVPRHHHAPIALDRLDAILSTRGLDAAFIGRGDLTVGLGACSANAPEVRTAVERITAAGLAAAKPLCAHVGDIASEQTHRLSSLGVSAFIVASDQGLLRRAGAQALSDCRKSL